MTSGFLLGGITLVVTCGLLNTGCGQPHGSGHDDWPQATGKAKPYRYSSETQLPYQQLGLNSGRVDTNGRPARVKCLTCHDKLQPNPKYQMATRLEKFHVGINLKHGDNTCRSCHRPPLYQDFKLVSGRSVDYANVIALCSQCHGQQRIDYDHGAHGGMNGYWDLNQGPRSRNHCLDCHNAHRPAIPQMVPAPYPKYRLMDNTGVEATTGPGRAAVTNSNEADHGR